MREFFYKYKPGQLLRRKVDGAIATYLGPPNGPWENFQSWGRVEFATGFRFFGSIFNVDLHGFEAVDMIEAIGGIKSE